MHPLSVKRSSDEASDEISAKRRATEERAPLSGNSEPSRSSTEPSAKEDERDLQVVEDFFMQAMGGVL